MTKTCTAAIKFSFTVSSESNDQGELVCATSHMILLLRFLINLIHRNFCAHAALHFLAVHIKKENTESTHNVFNSPYPPCMMNIPTEYEREKQKSATKFIKTYTIYSKKKKNTEVKAQQKLHDTHHIHNLPLNCIPSYEQPETIAFKLVGM
jgi:hypothetical protein